MKQIYELINENRDNLNRSDIDIANYILANQQQIAKLKLKKLAASCFVSPTTVIRFCQKLGFDGFKAFSVYVQLNQQKPEGYEENDKQEQENSIFDKHCQNILENVKKTLSNIDMLAIKKTANYICKAKRVDIYGLASSRYICQDLSRKLKMLGIWSHSVYESEMIQLSASTLSADDFCLIITLTGNNDTLVDALDVARHRGCYTATLTNNVVNRCASHSMLPIYVHVNAGSVHYNRYRPRYIFMIIIDLLIEECIQILDQRIQ